jgi:hypothetical protein
VFAESQHREEDALVSARDELRRKSKLMFGSSDRLEVALAIATSGDGLVNATDLSWDLHIANNRVRTQLVALSELGLLVPDQAAVGKKWYQRVDSPFWPTCLDLHRQWSA